jgi:O-succinylhomoserine sulfhydrylase
VTIFPKWNIKTVYAPIQDLSEWEAKITANTKMIYIETPSNPGVDLIDIEAVAALAKKHDLLLVVDNCFATPYLQQPIKWGADLVIHSATKFMDGQGRVLGGATVGRADLIKQVHSFSRSTGPALSPFNAWVLSKSLETLAVRMDRHSENAVKIAEFLEAHDDIEMVKYPFLPSHPGYAIAKKQMKAGGGVVTFSVKGGLERGKRFLNNIHLCSLTANLGDSRTIVTHPASTTHAKLTEEDRLASDITPGLIRISVGLEHHEDILADVEQALIASC